MLLTTPAHHQATGTQLSRPGQVNHLGHWLLAHTLLGHQRSRRKRRQDLAAHHHGMPALVHLDASTATSSSTAEDGAEGTRVIFLSSTTHRAGSLDWGDLQLRKEGAYSGFRGYANSKLAALLAAREFQHRLNRWATTAAHALHSPVVPGASMLQAGQECALGVLSALHGAPDDASTTYPSALAAG